MDENVNSLSDIITLEDETGQELKLQFLGEVDFENNTYIVFLPNYLDQDQDEVLILRIDKDKGEEEVFVTVEDERVIGEVFDIFMAENGDLYQLEGE